MRLASVRRSLFTSEGERLKWVPALLATVALPRLPQPALRSALPALPRPAALGAWLQPFRCDIIAHADTYLPVMLPLITRPFPGS